MLIDTHCHLDAPEFDADRDNIASLALQQGVSKIVIPAVAREHFDSVIQICLQHKHCAYALGIHPMYVDQAQLNDIETLKTYIENNNPVAIGEIGLDYFVTKNNLQLQTYFFTEQLKLAKQYNFPVILHVRNAIDDVLKYLRRYQIDRGIAHAFNGSFQQAEQLIALGFKLGFGGAMTFPRALQIRRLARDMPLEALVLETDAPDIAPAWVHPGRNSPEELPRIGAVLAELRGLTPDQIAAATSENACAALPRLGRLR